MGQFNKFKARMNGHKSEFRFYADGKINKMENMFLYDQLIYHYMNCFQVCIVDLIRVGNNNEHQLIELLSRNERKLFWDLGSIIPYGLVNND